MREGVMVHHTEAMTIPEQWPSTKIINLCRGDEAQQEAWHALAAKMSTSRWHESEIWCSKSRSCLPHASIFPEHSAGGTDSTRCHKSLHCISLTRIIPTHLATNSMVCVSLFPVVLHVQELVIKTNEHVLVRNRKKSGGSCKHIMVLLSFLELAVLPRAQGIFLCMFMSLTTIQARIQTWFESIFHKSTAHVEPT